ncbi:Fis family transcriptional regulator [Pseudodesulfovibrio nedwellii]|uniref:Fis family transcriptional regulator n=1 Tax=Pseudodesulfovibrio nedwellii TaxID=2973072 RepID=A0ABN6RXI3_9BACT|nr:sigma-54 dependent transcriptional regulator [Pseudodesulfovibrio nedwellii]BDQ35734.1 Fis family transcriptional regulator [Pseudodesulfovibrio nedwellii]
MAKVLVIDDDRMICDALMELIRNIGHEADYASSVQEGLEKNLAEEFDVVFLDIRLPDGNGLDILPQLRELPIPPEVIILTGLGDPDGAELAIRNGAWDYLQKPLSPKKILLPLQRVLKYRDTLRNEGNNQPPFKRCGIVGNGPAITHALERLGAAAHSDASLLLTGETGTGKELFARALHENSKRSRGPFVIVDCASIPANLLESTLFGHVKGAFTGADRSSCGLVLEAHGGTLFLDEIGEMPLPLQKKLLRVLQERKYRQVGGSQEVSSNFRLVAATHRDLNEMVQKGLFRNDLLYRLGAMTINLPVLRDRKEDLGELTQHFARYICEKNAIPPKTFSDNFMETLARYDWPGNIRELVNVLENAMISAYGHTELFAKHLPERTRIAMLKHDLVLNEDSYTNTNFTETQTEECGTLPSYKEYRGHVLEQADKSYFTRLMEASCWDIERACTISGLRKSRVYDQLKQYGIEKE